MLRRRSRITRLCLLLRILIAGLLRGVSGRRLLRVIRCSLLLIVRRGLLTRARIQAVAAVLTIAGRGCIVAGGVLSVKEAAHHFAHAMAEFGKKLQRIFILRRRLLWVAVTLRRLLIAGRRCGLILLRITTLRLRIVALLGLCRGR